jgi:hypothetical protein
MSGGRSRFIDEHWGDPWRGYKTPIYGNLEEQDENLLSKTMDTLGCATLTLGEKGAKLEAQSDSEMWNDFFD